MQESVGPGLRTRGGLSAAQVGADGTQVGAAVGQGFAEGEKGGRCQAVLRFGF